MKKILGRLKELREKYERRITTLAFIFGFVWDNLTLTRVDLKYDNLILIGHLLIAGAAIAIFGMFAAGRLRFLREYRELVPLVMQFSFGALFSGFFVFYSRGGSWVADWPFILLLALMLVGNEFFRGRYARITFNLSIYFVAILLYATFALPVVLGRMGVDVFILSGFLALLLASAFVYFLSRVGSFELSDARLRNVVFSIGGIYLVFNGLYFGNIIPPLPLSLKELGIYHEVRAIPGGYAVAFEEAPWYVFLQKESSTFHQAPGATAYAYSAVFAPTRIATTIYHRWYFYNEANKEWLLRDSVAFPISGGRDGGYRGYTEKSSLGIGRWRVEVTTERGQILGRRTFRVVDAETPPTLKTETR